MVIRSVTELKRRFYELTSGDVFAGLVAAGPTKAALLIDLAHRGIHCLPAPLAQMLNGSKVAQALILKEYMLPNTAVVTRPKELFNLIAPYNRDQIGAVVTKEDRLHCGRGICRWDSIETLYSFKARDDRAYPLVVQPFKANLTDVRVIMVDEYVEAYVRANAYNFRANISAGGQSRPYALDSQQERFCRDIMKRADFPFAHLDLQVMADGHYYLSEIALNGGIRAARIDRKTLTKRKQAVIDRLIDALR